MNTDMKGKKLISWRRSKVIEYSSKGFSQNAIARALQVSEPTISRDITFLKGEAKRNIQKFGDHLAYDYYQTLDGLTAILKEAWIVASKRDVDDRDKLQALSLAEEVYSTKLDLLTNCTVVDDVVKFIDEHHRRHEEKQQKEDEGEAITTTTDKEETEEGSESRDILQKSLVNSFTNDLPNNVTNEEVF